MSDFRNPALKQLTDQLAGPDKPAAKRKALYAPLAARQHQLARAGRLLTEIDPARKYPYQFVCYRVTEFRTDAYPDLLIDGGDLQHDLCLLIERLDRSLPPMPIEQALEPVVTIDQVGKQLNVSTKAMPRWK